ncbi:5-formyltetrahydrofolate cyclo-ligase [Nitrosomonas sp. JL21]|uniref:5-formyltetrahydrofolate cyclo-ligase n=1 Tax=Nitrosomonas sp. JL21 TaxID=153949 RepID=UPI00136F1016|nr:5-formyltetrahydrofolate cyclo-ligase [Nitrosomonas sp. JL21]MBL8497019.1 5-formyltetrahydrofolate cyclo-ligase [Nitrosomonas sp.]MCC7092050.1 5-formyltetrahydrofolate cyclo-ligase [Nitrosomonas sp.]MXS78164.1 5-formyltetrahydrofolate cyclo-ligase [Nitrosomonas sp. JL21]
MDNLSEWKKQQRQRLILAREAISPAVHRQWSAAISALLMQLLPVSQGLTLGIYWPFRGEYDPRQFAEQLRQQDTVFALPEVIDRNSPLCFREWSSDTPMKNGAYGIPVPIDTHIVKLDAVCIPMVGFDRQGYRLGYGSGYFDRTLADYYPQPLTIGIAFEMQRLDSVHPQPHDIAMHYIVTEAGIFKTPHPAPKSPE